jgi:hypothetical protein
MHRPIPLTGRLTWRRDLLLPFPSGLLPRPTPTATASLRAGGDGPQQPTGAPARRRARASPWPGRVPHGIDCSGILLWLPSRVPLELVHFLQTAVPTLLALIFS